MKTYYKRVITCLAILLPLFTPAQKTGISGKVSGIAAKAIKEIQFICDGKMQRLTLNKENFSFAGDLKIKKPQFVEIKSGNAIPQYYYILPQDKLEIQIEKSSMQESIVAISNSRSKKLQDIFAVFYKTLDENGIDTRGRDWQQLLFVQNDALLPAEQKLKAEMAKNAALLAAAPDFKKDVNLFLNSFRKYIRIDSMSLVEIETALLEVKKENPGVTALNIPFFREYLTDLTNAYAARTLEKYGLNLDYIKQRNVNQFIAAETIEKYVTDNILKSYLFSEKLKLELPTNGLKNEAFVNFLYSRSEQFVRDFYQERIDKLRENKLPEMNAPRKKAFNFLLHDSTGKEYRLADFKGKMLFLDFWASWCAPCKAQIPHQKELEKKYAGKDIVFLSISLDKSIPDWLKAVKEEDLHGYLLHAKGDFSNDLPRFYGIEAIPRYMLIDADGNMISDNMMKPQNKKEIMGVIDEELYAKNTETILEKHFKAIGADSLKKNGLYLEFRQSVVSFVSNGKIYYRYPDKLKLRTKFEESEQMLMILGKDYFKENVSVMNGEKISVSNSSMANIRQTWTGKLTGLELFLRKTVNNAVVKFAEENATADSAYVLKTTSAAGVEKYYINKRTYLIDKVVILNTNIEPRKGGGYLEAESMYEDYRNVNGVMIPFKVNQANLINIKIQQAEIKPMPDSEFRL